MLAEKRFAEILRLVEEHRTITVQELTEFLHTSESTVRRDLNTLDNMGKLRKVFGGATALEAATVTKDDIVTERQERNREEKLRIVKAAAAFIATDDFVFIDAGTTTALLAENITQTDAVYVTNAVYHARTLAQRGCKVYLIGGEFKLSTEAVIGGKALEDLSRYNFTKGFFGTNGISAATGFSTPDVGEAMVKAQALKKCKAACVLADPSKFGVVSSVTFARIEEAEIITTAVSLPEFRGMTNLLEVDKK